MRVVFTRLARQELEAAVRPTAHENAILRERPSVVGLRCANPTYG